MTITAVAVLFRLNGKMIKFEIKGETPSKKNSRINTRSGRSFPNKKYVLWHNDALLQLNAQICRMKEMPNLIDSPVKVSIYFFHGDHRRRDSDNQLSSVMDLLQDAKVLADDNWNIVRELHIRNYIALKDAHCEIEIEELSKWID